MLDLDQCHGKWRSILTGVGVPGALLTGKHQPCPWCGGIDRFRWTNVRQKGGYLCSQCGHGDGVDFIMRWTGVDFRAALARIGEVIGGATAEPSSSDKSDAAKIADMRKLWARSQIITDDCVVARYLASRGIRLDTWPDDLRQVDQMMVAIVRAPDGKPVNVHRTYLTADGKKIPGCARKLMPGSCPSGSAIRLGPPAERMGIAEGIETALSAAIIHGVPVWSAINDLGVSRFEPPAVCRRLVVSGDNDLSAAGQAASWACAKANRGRGIDVGVVLPDHCGQDWNDVLTERMVLSSDVSAGNPGV